MSLLKCSTLLALVAVLDAARLKCDYNFYKDAGGYLKFQEMPLKFDAAKQRCASEGGILASPINDGIKAAMMGIMNTRNVDSIRSRGRFVRRPVKKTVAFTGISKKSVSNGIFSSVEGIRLSDIPHTWALHEPDNYKDEESCIAMLPDGTMADVKCDEPLPHFCFLKEARAKRLNACSPQHNDYTLDTATGSCYKYHKTPQVFDEAANVCKTEGGHLLIINGETEAEAIHKLFSKEKAVWVYIFIGFRYNHDLGEWMTVKGETIKEAGYEKWAKGEPNNHENSEFCGTLYHDGDGRLMNDGDCRRSLNFICEKDPEILLCK